MVNYIFHFKEYLFFLIFLIFQLFPKLPVGQTQTPSLLKYLEEKFQEVFERFETLEKDELSGPVTSDEEESVVRCDAEKEHEVEFFLI